MQSERIPASPCPSCGTMLDARERFGILAQGTTVAGDVTVCIKCGGLAAFTRDLRLRACSEAELVALSKDPGFLRVRDAVLVSISRRQDGNG